MEHRVDDSDGGHDGTGTADHHLQLPRIRADEQRQQRDAQPRRDVPRTIVIAGVLIGSFYLISTIGMQIVMPADEISETSGLMDVLKSVFGSGVLVTLVGIGILYAFFAALIPWTIGANRAAAKPPSKATCRRCSSGSTPSTARRWARPA